MTNGLLTMMLFAFCTFEATQHFIYKRKLGHSFLWEFPTKRNTLLHILRAIADGVAFM